MLLDVMRDRWNRIREAVQPKDLRRVFAVFLGLILLVQVSLPYLVNRYYESQSRTYVYGQRLPRNFEQIHKDFPLVLRYIEKHLSDYDINVLFLGDSVAYGAGVGENESIPAYLEEELKGLFPGKKVRVWNLAVPGSEPGDLYCVLRRVSYLHPDAVVADFNLLFYGKASIKDPVAFNWLYLDPGLPADAVQKVNTVYPRPFPDRVAEFFDRYFPLYHYRELINSVLFGGHPRDKVEAKLKALWQKLSGGGVAASAASPGPAAAADRAKQREKVAFMYDSSPINTETNAAYLFSEAVLEFLERQEYPSFVFLTDQNRDILGPLVTNPGFVSNARLVESLLRRYQVPYLSFFGRMPGESFVDHVHLNPDGNRKVARELARELAPRLRGVSP